MERIFCIVNDIDRPSERMIAEIREGRCFYIHPDLEGIFPDGMENTSETTELDRFGIEVSLSEGVFSGRVISDSLAQYRYGDSRRWQGSESFSFPMVS